MAKQKMQLKDPEALKIALRAPFWAGRPRQVN